MTFATLHNRKSIIAVLLLFFCVSLLRAQSNPPRISLTSKCLEVHAVAKYIDSSCESVAWYIGNTSTPTAKGLSLKTTFKTAGTYKICMQVYNFCKRSDTTICSSVTVKGCDPCDSVDKKLYITKDSSKCGLYYFRAKPLYNSGFSPTYKWQFGDGSSSTNDDPNHQYKKDSTYRMCVLVGYTVSNKKCSTTLCETIKVNCNTKTTKCNWKEKNIYTSNNCNKWVFEAPNYEDSCMQYKWTINGKYYYDRVARVTFEKKDSFVVCLTLKNACTGCDTTFCDIVSNSCLPNKKCNWKEYNLSIGHALSKEKCGSAIFEATYQKDTCIKIEFYFDGKLTSGRYKTHQFKENGRYKYGFRYINSCTGCDTIIYKWIEISCFESKKCDWSKLKLSYTPLRENCMKYIFEMTNYEDSCIQQKLKIVSGNTVIYQEYGRIHDFLFKENGYYNVCMWAYDECLKCDTWICETVYVNCEPAEIKSFNKTGIQFSPNPSHGNLHLNISTPTRISITSLEGKVLIEYHLVESDKNIDLQHLSVGTYIFTSSNELGTYSQKLVIQAE
ncbi:MAG: PKD domain-containing protein [Bacteroidia bacterium]